MSFAKSPLRRGRNGRAAHARFVEVEMPAVAARPLVIELEGGGRVLLSEPVHVALLVQLLVSLVGHREGGRPGWTLGWLSELVRIGAVMERTYGFPPGQSQATALASDDCRPSTSRHYRNDRERPPPCPNREPSSRHPANSREIRPESAKGRKTIQLHGCQPVGTERPGQGNRPCGWLLIPLL